MAEQVAHGAPEGGHESGDIATRRILWIALALVAVIGLSCLGAWLYLRSLGGGRTTGWVTPSIDSRSLPPPPGLETRPAATMPDYLRQQRERLETYRWINRDAGIVQIPIDRAMQLEAQRHARPSTDRQSTEQRK